MILVNFTKRTQEQVSSIINDDIQGELFLVAEPKDMPELQPVFGFDHSTVLDCLHYDENIRHTVFPDYDFVSLIHFYADKGLKLKTFELNVFIGRSYCVLVMPSEDEPRLAALRERILNRALLMGRGTSGITRAYYIVYDEILTSWSQTMEFIEDEMNEIERLILEKKMKKTYFENIHHMREVTYTVKKLVRPVVYIGDAFLMNENNMISKESMKFFKSIDARINKLHDFSVSLQDYSNQTLSLYESKTSMQTNEVVNKLTLLTAFFGAPTVIAGIYGMNFHLMPELEWTFGYPFALGLMALSCVIIYTVIKLKKWF